MIVIRRSVGDCRKVGVEAAADERSGNQGIAMAVGFAQVLSLIPGSSRSGQRLWLAFLWAETRETAARFRFYCRFLP